MFLNGCAVVFSNSAVSYEMPALQSVTCAWLKGTTPRFSFPPHFDLEILLQMVAFCDLSS